MLTSSVLARPHSTGGSSSGVAVLAAPLLIVLLMVALVGLSLWVILGRRRQTRDAASRAFAALGLVPRAWGMIGWQANGAVHGRPISVALSAGARHSPSSLVVEVTSAARFDVTIGPSLGSGASWVRSMIVDGTEVAAPGFPPRSIHSADPQRARALVEGSVNGIQRMLAPRVAGQVRWVFGRRGSMKLQVLGDAWQTLTPESLRADVDQLVALAAAAEHL